MIGWAGGGMPDAEGEGNPWYKLATLHGEPKHYEDKVVAENRVTWNRWMAPRIPDDLKAVLLKKGYTLKELTPFPGDELPTIDGISAGAEADFSDTKFEALFANNFVFPGTISFAGATFSDYAVFDGATFSGEARFDGATFSNDASFGSATFSGEASFDGATFGVYANFYCATFGGIANFYCAKFINATFRGGVNFGEAKFRRHANFSFAKFSCSANFERAKFRNSASFFGATLSGNANFSFAKISGKGFDFINATFGDDTDFSDATFSSDASFSRATFHGNAVFTNAEMKARTSFNDAKFSTPPQCFETKLHQGTTWHGVHWPGVARTTAASSLSRRDQQLTTIERAKEFTEAYACLKLEMDRLKKHGEELDFFARELQCRRVLLGQWKGLPIAVYGLLSDYGRSYSRPLLWLVVVVTFGAVPIRAHFGGGWSISTFTDHGISGGAVALSFANTFSALGFRKDLIYPELVQILPGWLKVFAALQTILGIVLLFLFGLGIRNRFRMK
jgi:pentapeptide repeat protein